MEFPPREQAVFLISVHTDYLLLSEKFNINEQDTVEDVLDTITKTCHYIFQNVIRRGLFIEDSSQYRKRIDKYVSVDLKYRD